MTVLLHNIRDTLLVRSGRDVPILISSKDVRWESGERGGATVDLHELGVGEECLGASVFVEDDRCDVVHIEYEAVRNGCHNTQRSTVRVASASQTRTERHASACRTDGTSAWTYARLTQVATVLP